MSRRVQVDCTEIHFALWLLQSDASDDDGINYKILFSHANISKLNSAHIPVDILYSRVEKRLLERKGCKRVRVQKRESFEYLENGKHFKM